MSSSHSTEIKPFFLRTKVNLSAFTNRRDLDVNTFVSYLAQNIFEVQCLFRGDNRFSTHVQYY